MGIVIMPECCVNASLFLIAELRPANFSDAFWCQKIVSLSTAENPRVLIICPKLTLTVDQSALRNSVVQENHAHAMPTF